MALLLSEGFDLYEYSSTSNWILDNRWSRYGNNEEVVAASGRRGGPCIVIQDQNSNSLTVYWIRCNLGSGYSTLFFEFAYRAATSALPPTANFPIFVFMRGTDHASGTQLAIHRTTTDGLQVRATAGGTLLASSAAGVVTPGFWQFWQIKIVCHASAGSILINIDGNEVINQGSINTQNAGAGAIQYWDLRSYSSSYQQGSYIDDLCILDDSGSAPFNDFLGDWKHEGHLPTGDGVDADWASTLGTHYDAINDVGSTYATNYLQSDTVGDQDSFTISPGNMTSIQGVKIQACARNPGGGTAKMKPYVLIGGTRYYGDEVTLGASVNRYSYFWAQNPATVSAWVKSDLLPANAEFGWETTELS